MWYKFTLTLFGLEIILLAKREGEMPAGFISVEDQEVEILLSEKLPDRVVVNLEER